MSRNEEIQLLAEEIIRNIELSELPLRNVVIKCARLARLTDNQRAINLFQYELAGYPKDDQGFIQTEAFNLARFVNRTFVDISDKKEKMFIETVAELESELEAAKEQMKVAYDPNVSLSSSNPYQHVGSSGNFIERTSLRTKITNNSRKLDQLKIGYYYYVLGVLYELKYNALTENIFEKKKLIVDKKLAVDLPKTFQKFVSVYENLRSGKEENWANAVHSCRRIIKDVADFLYPPSETEIEVDGKRFKLNDENYILRLKQYIKDKQDSDKFKSVVGSHLDYIGDRIDSIYSSSTKGSHANVTQEEAERYVIYTYLLLGDILGL